MIFKGIRYTLYSTHSFTGTRTIDRQLRSLRTKSESPYKYYYHKNSNLAAFGHASNHERGMHYWYYDDRKTYERRKGWQVNPRRVHHQRSTCACSVWLSNVLPLQPAGNVEIISGMSVHTAISGIHANERKKRKIAHYYPHLGSTLWKVTWDPTKSWRAGLKTKPR